MRTNLGILLQYLLNNITMHCTKLRFVQHKASVAAISSILAKGITLANVFSYTTKFNATFLQFTVCLY